MIKCNCFSIDQYVNYKKGLVRVYRCNGTKEREICTCGGDQCKCSEYPEIKAKALKEEANRKMAKKIDNFNKYVENYIGKKYDITGNVYELIDYLFISHSLYFQSVNDDSFLIFNVDKVNLDEYIK